jgi:hypothetical protein
MYNKGKPKSHTVSDEINNLEKLMHILEHMLNSHHG